MALTRREAQMLKNMIATDALGGLQVKVYRNLHKKCLSVWHAGYVVAHVDSITLDGVLFKVNEAGRQRVLREKKKNVHAFVTGTVTGVNAPPRGAVPVSYNPYKGASFTLPDGQAIMAAGTVTVTTRGAFVD